MNNNLQINKNIGIFIDGDNAYEKTFNTLINHIKKYGKIIINRVYGNFSKKKYREKWKDVCLKYGVEQIQCQSTNQLKNKNSADIHMIDDMYMFLYEYKNLDTFVIVSCDSDFVVAVRRLKMNNKQVIIVGDNENTSQLLKATCDEFINVNYLPSKFNKDDLVSEINDIFDQFNTEEIYLGRLTETLKMRDSTFNPKKI